MMRLILALLLLSCPALAGDRLSTSELNALLPGKTVSFSNGGVATFKRNGTYHYRPNRGWGVGKYRFTDNRVCAYFAKIDRHYCWTYFREGKGYYLVSNGRRIGIRLIR